MYLAARTMTLAAQTFSEHPALRTSAKKSTKARQLKRDAGQITLGDGLPQLYVVEGDLLLDEDELQFYALQKEAQQQARRLGAVPPSDLDGSEALVAVSAAGKVVRWPPGMVLKYCVLKDTFLSTKDYDLARRSMKAATEAWQDTCGVEFEHVPELDSHPDPTTRPDEIGPGIVFSVRHFDSQGKFIASAFFPTQPPVRRRVLIDPSFFAKDLRFSRVGVLRHELGHVLGFRHEHIRSGAPAVCPDEVGTDTIDLTEYDPRSVMHYFCGGVGTKELAISELDRLGAQKVYGPPFESLMFVQ